MFNLLSSPYLLVFGDDRVRSTCERMMLMQMVMVKLRHEVGITWEPCINLIEIFCKLL